MLCTIHEKQMAEVCDLIAKIRTPEHHIAAFGAIQMMERGECDAEEYHTSFLAGRINAQFVPVPFAHEIQRPVEGLIFPDLINPDAVWFYTHPARRRWAGVKYPIFLSFPNKSGCWFDQVVPAEKRHLWHAVNSETPWSSGTGFFRVHANPHDMPGVQICAHSWGDALDEAADYWDESGWEGFFMDEASVEEYRKDGFEEEIVYAGNHGRPVLGHEIVITEISDE